MKNTINYYEKHAKEFCQQTINVDMSSIQDIFLMYLSKDAYILDAGCGSGRDSLFFLSRGYKVMAMDGSKQICEEAEKLLKQSVLNLNFSEIDFEEEFDGIWACASLLHVSKNDIEDVLNKLYDSLKKNGILYASFKYGESEHVVDEKLYNDYNEDALQALFLKTSFNIKEIFVTQDNVPGRISPKWINIIVQK